MPLSRRARAVTTTHARRGGATAPDGGRRRAPVRRTPRSRPCSNAPPRLFRRTRSTSRSRPTSSRRCPGREGLDDALTRASPRRTSCGRGRSRWRALRQNPGGHLPPRHSSRRARPRSWPRSSRRRCPTSKPPATTSPCTSATPRSGRRPNTRARDAVLDAYERPSAHAQRAGHGRTSSLRWRAAAASSARRRSRSCSHGWTSRRHAGVRDHVPPRVPGLALAMLGRFDEARAILTVLARSWPSAAAASLLANDGPEFRLRRAPGR